MKYVCDVCGWEYDEEAGDPDNGIAPGTKWEDLPEDFTCPLCGVGKDRSVRLDFTWWYRKSGARYWLIWNEVSYANWRCNRKIAPPFCISGCFLYLVR